MAMSFVVVSFLLAHNRFKAFGLIDVKKLEMWFETKNIDYQILNL